LSDVLGPATRNDEVMTTAELEIEQLRATITRLNAETAKLIAETSRINSEMGRTRADTGKLSAETVKLTSESRKFLVEAFWYPLGIAVAFVGTVAGVTVALTKLLS
jgi:chromosome segregation ATPase